jgi:hypothetical protein
MLCLGCLKLDPSAALMPNIAVVAFGAVLSWHVNRITWCHCRHPHQNSRRKVYQGKSHDHMTCFRQLRLQQFLYAEGVVAARQGINLNPTKSKIGKNSIAFPNGLKLLTPKRRRRTGKAARSPRKQSYTRLSFHPHSSAGYDGAGRTSRLPAHRTNRSL